MSVGQMFFDQTMWNPYKSHCTIALVTFGHYFLSTAKFRQNKLDRLSLLTFFLMDLLAGFP
jgi:hypothetical protein